MDEICVMNIDRAGARARLVSGIVAVALSIGAAIYLIITNAPPAGRLALFAPLLFGMLGIAQARAKT